MEAMILYMVIPGVIDVCIKNQKSEGRKIAPTRFMIIWLIISLLSVVGMTGFEPATTRPPDAYSKPD